MTIEPSTPEVARLLAPGVADEVEPLLPELLPELRLPGFLLLCVMPTGIAMAAATMRNTTRPIQISRRDRGLLAAILSRWAREGKVVVKSQEGGPSPPVVSWLRAPPRLEPCIPGRPACPPTIRACSRPRVRLKLTGQMPEHLFSLSGAYVSLSTPLPSSLHNFAQSHA